MCIHALYKLALILVCFIPIKAEALQSSVIVFDGVYQGKDIFVTNPDRFEGAGKSVFKVTVNGKITTDEINSSAFIIDLSLYEFLIGDKVEIKIFHALAAKPKVINPEVLLPKSTFDIEEITIDEDENLVWKTTNETFEHAFVIEQFKWNKWVKVGEVKGVGAPTIQSYKFKLEMHSGENKFRVYQKDYTGKKRVSETVNYLSAKPKVKFFPKKVRTTVTFSDETNYEILDSYGNLLKKGTGKKADFTKLKKGFYYLNYDNRSDGVNKK